MERRSWLVLAGAGVGVGAVLYAIIKCRGGSSDESEPESRGPARASTFDGHVAAPTDNDGEGTPRGTARKESKVPSAGEANPDASIPPPQDGEAYGGQVLREAVLAAVSAERLTELIEKGCTPQEDPATGRSLLHDAVEHMAIGQEDTLPVLWEAGADVEAEDRKNGCLRPLHLACAMGKATLAKALLERCGAAATSANPEGWTPLHFAASTNRLEIVEFLLETKYCVDVNATNKQGSTPLMLAITSRSVDTAAFMLTAPDVDVHTQDRVVGASTLHLATLGGYKMYKVVETLLEMGVDVDIRDNTNKTPLHWALQRGHGRLSTLFIMKGAKADAADTPHKVTPLHMAAASDDVGMLETFMLNCKPLDLNVRDDKGRTPLVIAAVKGASKTVASLIAAGADVNAVDIANQCALAWAIHGGYRECAMALLESGRARVDIVDEHGNSLLLLACLRRSVASVAESLVSKYQAPVNVSDAKGRTPLHLVAATGDVQLFTTLLEEGADIEAATTDGDGALPIHWAAKEGQYNTAEMLFEAMKSRHSDWDATAVANVADAKGRTPLHWCLAEGNETPAFLRTIRFLIRSGADLSAEDANGECCRQLLEDNYDDPIAEEMVALASERPPPGQSAFGGGGGGGFTAFGE